MLLSVYMPHSGRDEGEALETARATLTEGREAGAVDFFTGGDINIELRLGNAGEHLHGVYSIDWYGTYGPECKGGGEDVTTHVKKIRWLQLLKEINCTVTSTWTNNDDNCESHTWRARRSRVCKKQLDSFVGPKDLRSTTWFLNKVRLRTWDHFPVVVKIEGKELRTKKGVKGWAGWNPASEVQKSKFQELVLCPSGDRNEIRQDGRDGLVALQERLEEAAAAVKATTTAVRNRNKFTVPDEIREMAAEAATCRDLVRRKLLRKRAHKARREFKAGRAVLPGGKVIHRPVVTKLKINGRASEDGDEWTEGVRAHCEKVTTTKRRRLRSRPEGLVTKEVAVTAWSFSKADTYRSQSTGFSVHGGK